MVAALCSVALSACDAAPPAFVERATIADTDLETGPYEVRVVLHDRSGVSSVRLFWAPADGIAGAAKMLPMVRDGEINPLWVTDEDTRPRYVGHIPGHPLGTVVEWGVEACDGIDNCGVDPPLFPLDAFRFTVGVTPSEPVIDSVAPGIGPSSGGTRVVIDGHDFRPGARVFFGLEESPHVEWIARSRVTARAPEHVPGVVDMTVRNPDSMEARLREAFEYYPAPELYSVFPDQGPTAGGTRVDLVGANFEPGVRAFFDGLPCRNPLLFDTTLLQCSTPPGAAGFVDVEVRDTGTGVGRLPSGFLYVAPPLVNGASPDRGTDLGGTTVEITGENFDENATVLVNGQPCLQTTWIDDETLLCVVPPGSPGIVDIVVVNEDGQSATLPGGFNYLGPPVVVQVIPPLGPIAGGVEVRLIGAGFTENMLVTFGGAEAVILDVLDDLELVVELPPSSLPLTPAPASGIAPVDVFVQNLDPMDMRSDFLEDGFGYIWPPEVFEVIPALGPTDGGTPVTLLGRFFFEIPPSPIETFFGESAVSALTVVSTTTITTVTPPGPPGFVDVTVRNFENSEGTCPECFLYIPPPEVIDVQPGEGPTFGGERVIIVGEFFQEGAIVIFEGVGECTDVIYVSETLLECTTPPAAEPGFVDVIVINPDGQEGEGEQLYEYVPVRVVPDFGLEGGLTFVRVLAAGMQDGVTIRFGDTLASDCTRISLTEVQCQSPPASAPGVVEVSFLNPNGTGDANPEGFEYRRFVLDTDDRLQRSTNSANHVEAGDVDNDGDLDLVVANGQVGNGQTDFLHINDGAGFFTRQALPGGQFVSNSADFGRWNDDNLLDIVIGVSDFGGAVLYENLGGGAFALQPTPSANFGTVTGAFDAALTDLVGDDRDDLLILAIGCSNDIDANCDDFAAGADGLFERTGDNGQWSDQSNQIPHDLGLVHDHKIADPDLDGDGDRDLVLFVDNGTAAFASAGNEHRVLYNRDDDGLSFEEERDPFDGLVGDVFGVDYGDIDGDGDPDVLAGNCNPPFGSSEVVYRNEGGQLVREFNAFPNETDDCDWGVHLFDVDFDGDLDVAFTGDQNGELLVKMYVARGDGTFQPSFQSIPAFPDFAVNTRGAELASGDFDGDGDLDLALAATDNPQFFIGGTVELLMLDQVD